MNYPSNYPTGASCDPDAPFNQPMRDEGTHCEFEHEDREECDGPAPHDCKCGTACCDAAVVVVRSEWRGRMDHEAVCLECAERYHMVPRSTKAVISYLRRALNHAVDSRVPGSDVYASIVNNFAAAFEAIAKDRLEAEDAIIRVGHSLRSVA